MGNNMRGLRSVVLIAAVVLLVLGILTAAVFLTVRSGTRNTITLPEAPVPAPPESESPAPSVQFVEVDRENIQEILRSMERPEAYHQILSVTNLWPGGSSGRTVEIFRSGPLALAKIIGEGRDRSLLTDGRHLWIWYAGETEARMLLPEDSVSFDDLIGIPTYETVSQLRPSAIQEAGFVALDGANCLYISSRDGAGEERYWVDAASQLLCRADALEGDQLTYQLLQTLWEVLPTDDASLEGRFRLPDGTTVSAPS